MMGDREELVKILTELGVGRNDASFIAGTLIAAGFKRDRPVIHAYGSRLGLTMCGIHETDLPPQYDDYRPPRRATKDRDADVTCASCLDRLYE
jgi:hypothetical protein